MCPESFVIVGFVAPVGVPKNNRLKAAAETPAAKPNARLLDVAGPFEMLSWAGFDITIAAQEKGLVECRGGLAIRADTSFADSPRFDILWTPGGDPDSLSARMQDAVFLDFLVRQSQGASYVCSVCEGALLLAAAGLLDGYEATTHWAFTTCLTEYFPKVKVAPGHPRFWLDHNRLTGGGISSGLDEALELIRIVKGKDAASLVQQTTQYYPEPPVQSEIPPAGACPVSICRARLTHSG
jgi:transcriptional regulator GlxA family with amidase domain